MSLETLPAKEKKWISVVQNIIWNILQRAMWLLNIKVYIRSAEFYEKILKEIADLPNFYRNRFDIHESYYPKLLDIFEVENDIRLIASDMGHRYKVEWCRELFFTRLELQKIWERYTQIKYPELSEELT